MSEVDIRLRQAVQRPSELALTLATVPGRYGASDGWVSADEVRGRLVLLGFQVKAQQVAAWLKRMAETECPWVERREHRWGRGWEYRVTRFGRTDVDNRFVGVRLHTPWIETFRRAAPSDDAAPPGAAPANHNGPSTDDHQKGPS